MARGTEMDSCREIILHLLHNLGNRREIDRYLEVFSREDTPCSAVVKVGGGTLESELGELASALAFLGQVGLRPVVVHGGGPQLDRALREAGIESPRIGGRRVTTPETLEVARRVFGEESEKLAAALEQAGVRARPMPSSVIETEIASDGLGLVGKITRVNDGMIRSALERGQLPVMSPLGETAGGQITNVNADEVTREVAVALQPRKVIFLTPTGGLLDEKGRVIPAVNLAADFERLMGEAWVSGGMSLKLSQIDELLARMGVHSSVSITSTQSLAKELFTHTGQGTLLRRGVRIDSFGSLDQLDEDRLNGLLERSFGRRLRPGDLRAKTIDRILLSHDYSAAAVMTKAAGTAYLDKFAVTAEAQGAGIGQSLWSRVTSEYPAFFWRSRADNEINPWYFRRADGMRRDERWVVFWRGIGDWTQVERCIDYALSCGESFLKAGEGVGVGK